MSDCFYMSLYIVFFVFFAHYTFKDITIFHVAWHFIYWRVNHLKTKRLNWLLKLQPYFSLLFSLCVADWGTNMSFSFFSFFFWSDKTCIQLSALIRPLSVFFKRLIPVCDRRVAGLTSLYCLPSSVLVWSYCSLSCNSFFPLISR